MIFFLAIDVISMTLRRFLLFYANSAECFFFFFCSEERFLYFYANVDVKWRHSLTHVPWYFIFHHACSKRAKKWRHRWTPILEFVCDFWQKLNKFQRWGRAHNILIEIERHVRYLMTSFVPTLAQMFKNAPPIGLRFDSHLCGNYGKRWRFP